MSRMATMREDFRMPQDIYVPQFENGTVLYSLMQIVATSDFDGGWVVKEVPIPIFPATTEPTPVKLISTAGLGIPTMPHDGPKWIGAETVIE